MFNLSRFILFTVVLSTNSHLVLADKDTANKMHEQEIHALIQSVEQSECTFVRNNKEYTASEAADHLRLKWRKGKKYASTAESFIDLLASKSSFSGKPYHLKCTNQEQQTSNAWLHGKLKELRKLHSHTDVEKP